MYGGSIPVFKAIFSAVMDVMKSYPFPLNTHFGIAVTESLGIGYFEGIGLISPKKCFQTFRPGHQKIMNDCEWKYVQ